MISSFGLQLGDAVRFQFYSSQDPRHPPSLHRASARNVAASLLAAICPSRGSLLNSFSNKGCASTTLNLSIKLLERTRWKDRDTFVRARHIQGSIDKLRKNRQLEIADEQVLASIDAIAVHLADTMEPDVEFRLEAYQPSRGPQKPKRPSISRGRRIVMGNLWKELVAREHQASIEVCVYSAGSKELSNFVFRPHDAESEHEIAVFEEEFHPKKL
jgi:hypothetical protein